MVYDKVDAVSNSRVASGDSPRPVPVDVSVYESHVVCLAAALGPVRPARRGGRSEEKGATVLDVVVMVVAQSRGCDSN